MNNENFFKLLNEKYPNISLSEEETEYLNSLLEEEITIDDLREISEVFLQNAGLNENDCDIFYSTLKEKYFNSNIEEEQKDEIKLTKKIEKQEVLSLNSSISSLSLNSIKEPKKEIIKKNNRKKSNDSKTMRKKGKRKEKSTEKKIDNSKDDNSQYNSLKNINAFSQVSRFHNETIDSFSKDIDLKDLNISVNDNELLVDSNLKLYQGVHYGLIGQNGIGKSTLLKSIGYKLIIGFPEGVQVHYVEQLENIDLEKPVIDTIIESNIHEERIKREAKILQNAIEHGNTGEIVEAILKIKYDRLCYDLSEQEKVFLRRSGDRCTAAKVKYFEIENEVNKAKEAMSKKYSHSEEQDLVLEANNTLNELYVELDMLDAEASYAKASKILYGLGFSEEWQKGPMNKLSGGWRIRASLAQALFLEPTILLLDEPTNHLDFPAIIWLEDYIKSLTETTLVIVSHDRAFLNATVNEIIVFKNKKLKYYTGNYDTYELAYNEELLYKTRMKESIDKKKETLEKNIQKSLQMAKKSGDDKRLNQMASRKKKLTERVGIEKSASGHRFKLNRDLMGYYTTRRADVEFEKEDTVAHWEIAQPSKLRNQDSLLKVQDISFKYGKDLPWVIRDATLNVELGEKIGLMGANGEGKSTFVSILIDKLNPVEGTVVHHPQAKIGSFAQHDVEYLINNYSNTTVIEYLSSKFKKAESQELFNLLGSFGINGSIAFQPISTLSGGQAVRVSMAVAFYNRPHLLILDEPTNHLDTSTIEVMISNLKKFEGSVILVSHDQYFVEQVAQKVLYLKNHHFRELIGGVKEYINIVKKSYKN